MSKKIIESPQFFLVWKEDSSMSTPTYKHGTYQGAKEEAARLTAKHGGQFHVLAHQATLERVDIQLTEVDQIPF